MPKRLRRQGSAMKSLKMSLSRNKIAEYYTNSNLQTILMKIWTKLIASMSLDPFNYQRIIRMISKSLGEFGDDKYYQTKIPEYKYGNVTYDKYCFDIISLFGK
mmetsp:Transcript_6897/g.6416  ORF Transcript_6897/g.6416 Transcript_6897/m.6416 type:complete len:103 (+) Transcript_6897:90-398(+)